MDIDLDTLLIALYVELTDRIVPLLESAPDRPGRPPEVTDAELVCIAVARRICGSSMNATGSARPARTSGTCFPGSCLNPSTTCGCAGSAR